MTNRALVYSSTARARLQYPGDPLWFPLELDLKWGRDKSGQLITALSISKDIAEKIPRRGCRAWDEQHMHDFLIGNSLDHVTMPKFCDHRDFFPAGASLLDFIVQDLDRKDAWMITESTVALFKGMQATRGVSYDLIDQVSVREIIVGETPAKTIRKRIDWFKEKHYGNQKEAPTKLLSLDCEESPVPKDLFEKILGAKAGETFTFPTIIKKGTKCKQLPVKIMVGDGYTWALMITILVIPSSGGLNTLIIPKVQDELIELLLLFPKVTGVGVGSDLMEVEEVYGAWSGRPNFKMSGFVDLSAVSRLLGYNLRLTNMPILSVQVLGGVLNKSVSQGDSCNWGLAWREIPESLRLYCLADVKFGHQCAVVMLRALLIDMFPDPDVILSFTRQDAHTFSAWFNGWVVSILTGVTVKHDAIEGATTRQGLVKCLRYWVQGQGMSSTTPCRITAFAGLLGNWPSLMNGGCRYLHQARTHCLTQVQELKRLDVPGWNDHIMPYEIDDEMKEAATYTVAHLHTVSFRDATRVDRGLVCHSDFFRETLLYIIKGGKLTSKVLLEHAYAQERVARECLYEWVRLNLGEIENFLKIILNDRHYNKHLGTFYSEARQIYFRCTGSPAPRVAAVDAESKRRAAHELGKERDFAAALKTCLDARLKRVAYYSGIIADEDYLVPNLSWRGQVPPFIGKKKVGIKRSRTEYTPGEPAHEFEDPLREDLPEDVQMLEFNEDPSEGRFVSKKRKKGGPGGLGQAGGPAPLATQDEIEEFVSLRVQASSSPTFFAGTDSA